MNKNPTRRWERLMWVFIVSGLLILLLVFAYMVTSAEWIIDLILIIGAGTVMASLFALFVDGGQRQRRARTSKAPAYQKPKLRRDEASQRPQRDEKVFEPRPMGEAPAAAGANDPYRRGYEMMGEKGEAPRYAPSAYTRPQGENYDSYLNPRTETREYNEREYGSPRPAYADYSRSAEIEPNQPPRRPDWERDPYRNTEPSRPSYADYARPSTSPRSVESGSESGRSADWMRDPYQRPTTPTPPNYADYRRSAEMEPTQRREDPLARPASTTDPVRPAYSGYERQQQDEPRTVEPERLTPRPTNFDTPIPSRQQTSSAGSILDDEDTQKMRPVGQSAETSPFARPTPPSYRFEEKSNIASRYGAQSADGEADTQAERFSPLSPPTRPAFRADEAAVPAEADTVDASAESTAETASPLAPPSQPEYRYTETPSVVDEPASIPPASASTAPAPSGFAPPTPAQPDYRIDHAEPAAIDRSEAPQERAQVIAPAPSRFAPPVAAQPDYLSEAAEPTAAAPTASPQEKAQMVAPAPSRFVSPVQAKPSARFGVPMPAETDGDAVSSLAASASDAPEMAQPTATQQTGFEYSPSSAVDDNKPILQPAEVAPEHTQAEPTLDVVTPVGQQGLRDALAPGAIVAFVGSDLLDKTGQLQTLVNEMANDGALRRDYPSGLVYYDFYDNPRLPFAQRHIADALGHSSEPAPSVAYRASMADKRALILLDHAEKAENLTALLAARGESTFILSLPTPQQAPDRSEIVAARALDSDESAELLATLAGSRANDRANVASIASKVGNAPVPLRLIGAYMNQEVESASAYLGRMPNDYLEGLNPRGGSSGDAELHFDRHLDLVTRQLSGDSAELYVLLGQCAYAPISPDFITGVLNWNPMRTEQALIPLREYGLVEPLDETYIGLTHTAIHTHAHEHAQGSVLVTRIGPPLANYVEQVGSDVVVNHEPHIFALLDALNEQQQLATVNRIAWAVDSALPAEGAWLEREKSAELGMNAAQALGERFDEMAHAAVLGTANTKIGRLDSGLQHYSRALVISRERNDLINEGAILSNIGQAYSESGDFDSALGMFEQALEIRQTNGDNLGLANTLSNVGELYINMNQPAQARQAWELAYEWYAHVGSPEANTMRALLSEL